MEDHGIDFGQHDDGEMELICLGFVLSGDEPKRPEDSLLKWQDRVKLEDYTGIAGLAFGYQHRRWNLENGNFNRTYGLHVDNHFELLFNHADKNQFCHAQVYWPTHDMTVVSRRHQLEKGIMKHPHWP